MLVLQDALELAGVRAQMQAFFAGGRHAATFASPTDVAPIVGR
jgi:hypothetical protein